MRFQKIREELKRKAASILELPGEVALNLPRIVITGRLQVVVENHRGIVTYNPETVHLLVEAGEVAISGRNLVLRSVLPEEIVVEGEIHGVTFPEP